MQHFLHQDGWLAHLIAANQVFAAIIGTKLPDAFHHPIDFLHLHHQVGNAKHPLQFRFDDLDPKRLECQYVPEALLAASVTHSSHHLPWVQQTLD